VGSPSEHPRLWSRHSDINGSILSGPALCWRCMYGVSMGPRHRLNSVGRRPTLACLRTSAGNGAQPRASMPPATRLAVARPPAHWCALHPCDFSACSNRLALARCVTSSWTSSTSLICARPDLSALVIHEGDDQLQVRERAIGRGAMFIACDFSPLLVVRCACTC
jgi:hypothetical protein